MVITNNVNLEAVKSQGCGSDDASRVRHPEKQLNKSTFSKKPPWIRVRARNNPELRATIKTMRDNRLNTVCEEAACPNLSECWSRKHAAFIVLGDVCTRACSFCNIATGKPNPVDEMEPIRVAESVAILGLKHVVITSVNRDDLQDGGAWHFVKCIASIRYKSPATTIEILTPDFLKSVDIIMDNAPPDVFNHNIETVPRLYRGVRPGSRYFRSLQLLAKVKEGSSVIFTKSGMMVGLGESDQEIYQVMDDLKSAGVDFLTVGQYLQPTPKHSPVDRFVHPSVFNVYEQVARSKGFLMVSASPLTRSSYHADSDFLTLKATREGALHD